MTARQAPRRVAAILAPRRVAATLAPRRVAAILACITLAGPALAGGPTGAWRGTYTCAQGVTALDLVLADDIDGGLHGAFHFTAAPSNPGVPEGCFSMRGHADAAGGHIRLTPQRWLLQPPGYVMIGLEGDIDRDSGLFAGRISPPVPGCTVFSLRPVDAAPTAPAACHTAATNVSATPGASSWRAAP